MFDVVGSFGCEEDADFGCGVGWNVKVGEELFESVFAGVVGEYVASGGDGVTFSGWWMLESFEMIFEFFWVGGGEVTAVEYVIQIGVRAGDDGDTGCGEVQD